MELGNIIGLVGIIVIVVFIYWQTQTLKKYVCGELKTEGFAQRVYKNKGPQYTVAGLKGAANLYQ